PAEPSTPAITGASGRVAGGIGGRTTRTGQRAWATTWALTEPSSMPENPPRPREPTTSRLASVDSARRAAAAPPRTRLAATGRPGPPRGHRRVRACRRRDRRPDHQDGAAGMGDRVGAHGAQQHAREPAQAARAHHEQAGVRGLGEEGRRGAAEDLLGGDRQTRVGGAQVGGQVAEEALTLLRRRSGERRVGEEATYGAA